MGGKNADDLVELFSSPLEKIKKDHKSNSLESGQIGHTSIEGFSNVEIVVPPAPIPPGNIGSKKSNIGIDVVQRQYYSNGKYVRLCFFSQKFRRMNMSEKIVGEVFFVQRTKGTETFIDINVIVSENIQPDLRLNFTAKAQFVPKSAIYRKDVGKVENNQIIAWFEAVS